MSGRAGKAEECLSDCPAQAGDPSLAAAMPSGMEGRRYGSAGNETEDVSMVSLTKGQSIRLEKSGGGSLSRVFMGVGWDVKKATGFGKFFGGGNQDIDLDASCLLFDAGREMLDVVWFRQLRSADGSIIHTGDNRTGAGDGDDEQIMLDLTRVPGNVTSIVFVVNSFTGETFDKVENAFCRLVDATSNAELARFDLTGAGPHTGQVMAKLTRGGAGDWTMTAIGQRTTGRTFHDMMPAITAHL
jgi:tellurium resistance protein TerZ